MPNKYMYSGYVSGLSRFENKDLAPYLWAPQRRRKSKTGLHLRQALEKYLCAEENPTRKRQVFNHVRVSVSTRVYSYLDINYPGHFPEGMEAELETLHKEDLQHALEEGRDVRYRIEMDSELDDDVCSYRFGGACYVRTQGERHDANLTFFNSADSEPLNTISLSHKAGKVVIGKDYYANSFGLRNKWPLKDDVQICIRMIGRGETLELRALVLEGEAEIVAEGSGWRVRDKTANAEDGDTPNELIMRLEQLRDAEAFERNFTQIEVLGMVTQVIKNPHKMNNTEFTKPQFDHFDTGLLTENDSTPPIATLEKAIKAAPQDDIVTDDDSDSANTNIPDAVAPDIVEDDFMDDTFSAIADELSDDDMKFDSLPNGSIDETDAVLPLPSGGLFSIGAMFIVNNDTPPSLYLPDVKPHLPQLTLQIDELGEVISEDCSKSDIELLLKEHQLAVNYLEGWYGKRYFWLEFEPVLHQPANGNSTVYYPTEKSALLKIQNKNGFDQAVFISDNCSLIEGLRFRPIKAQTLPATDTIDSADFVVGQQVMRYLSPKR